MLVGPYVVEQSWTWKFSARLDPLPLQKTPQLDVVSGEKVIQCGSCYCYHARSRKVSKYEYPHCLVFSLQLLQINHLIPSLKQKFCAVPFDNSCHTDKFGAKGNIVQNFSRVKF